MARSGRRLPRRRPRAGHLLGTETIAGWGSGTFRRLRPNVILYGEDEDGLVGRRVRLGGATLDVVQPMLRCVMVNRPQPGRITRNVAGGRTIVRQRGGPLAVSAVVVETGMVTVGDVVEVPT